MACTSNETLCVLLQHVGPSNTASDAATALLLLLLMVTIMMLLLLAPTIWSASMMTVLMENLRLQKLKRSSRLGPSRSMTMTLYSPSTPYHFKAGIPAAWVQVRGRGGSAGLVRSVHAVCAFPLQQTYLRPGKSCTALIHRAAVGDVLWWTPGERGGGKLVCSVP
eukprot:1143560-Pelagomonas_calceolata.AAC.8